MRVNDLPGAGDLAEQHRLFPDTLQAFATGAERSTDRCVRDSPCKVTSLELHVYIREVEFEIRNGIFFGLDMIFDKVEQASILAA